MDTLPKMLVVFGLLLDIIGVVVLTWDIIISPSNYWWPGILRKRIETSEWTGDMRGRWGHP